MRVLLVGCVPECSVGCCVCDLIHLDCSVLDNAVPGYCNYLSPVSFDSGLVLTHLVLPWMFFSFVFIWFLGSRNNVFEISAIWQVTFQTAAFFSISTCHDLHSVIIHYTSFISSFSRVQMHTIAAVNLCHPCRQYITVLRELCVHSRCSSMSWPVCAEK